MAVAADICECKGQISHLTYRGQERRVDLAVLGAVEEGAGLIVDVGLAHFEGQAFAGCRPEGDFVGEAGVDAWEETVPPLRQQCTRYVPFRDRLLKASFPGEGAS